MINQRSFHESSDVNAKTTNIPTSEYQELVDMLSDSEDDWEYTVSQEKSKIATTGLNMSLIEQSVAHPTTGLHSDYHNNVITDGAHREPLSELPDLHQIIRPVKPGSGPLDTKPDLSKLNGNISIASANSGSPTKPISISDGDTGPDTDNVFLENNESTQKDTMTVKHEDNSINIEPKKLLSQDDSFESPSTNENVSKLLKEVEKDTQQNSNAAQWGGKFTMQTQMARTPEIDELAIKLPPNTKIKVPIYLSREQEYVLELADKGNNIFYTGSAGTGKSVLLREMIKGLKMRYGNENVAVTASTGLAACNIGGVTIHSFAGIGLGQGDADKLYKKVRRSRKHLRRWESIKALVVDEISMIDGELLDKLDFIARKARRSHAPFGGIQVIFCGDFFQLPPVTKENKKPNFAFDAKSWKSGIDLSIMLEKVFRQQGDTKFIDMLNKMRMGDIDEETEREFKKLNRPLEDDTITPAELYSTRMEVDRANSIRLNGLNTPKHHFSALDGGELKGQEPGDKLLQNFLAPKELDLKIGAQVMMIKNVDATLVNGSLGKVIDFMDKETYMFYETMTKNPELTPKQLEDIKKDPKTLQEMFDYDNDTEDDSSAERQKILKDSYCKKDPNDTFIPLGKSIFEFIDELPTSKSESRLNIERKKALLKELHFSSHKRKLPLVRFKTSDMGTRTVLVEPEHWAIEDEHEKVLVSRLQVPLMLAWSLSIHKSQGQTLPKVKVDLKRVFEKGQAYVALSRAVSRDGLQVLNFNRARVNAHAEVIKFYKTLVSAENAMKAANKVRSESMYKTDESYDENITSFSQTKKRNLKFEHKLEYAPPADQIMSRVVKRSKLNRFKRKGSNNDPFKFGESNSTTSSSESITDMLRNASVERQTRAP